MTSKKKKKKRLYFIISLIDHVTDFVLLLFFILIFFIGVYNIYDTLLIYNTGNNADLKSYKPVISETNDNEIIWNTKELSKDVVAWLTVDDTNIDYPILQGKDNNEYLNKDPFGEYSFSGSIFLDFSNSKDFSDEYSLIYGHHMENGYMFGALDKFIDENYFNDHRIGTLTVGNSLYNILFFACLEADGTTPEIFIPGLAEKVLSYTKEHALIWNEPIEGRLLALSTCKLPKTTNRMILLGVIYNA